MKEIIKQKAPESAVYGLGLIGALFYFISSATGLWSGIIGVIKSLLWPAFLVYEAFHFFLS